MPVLFPEFKKGSFVTHEGKNAMILWINKGRRKGAIKYLSPHQNHPPKWSVELSKLTLVPEKKVYHSGGFSFYPSVAR
jgi:hypothetical protein